MDDAGTVCQCDVAVTHHIPAFFFRADKVEQRLILLIFQILADVRLQNVIGALAQHGIGQRLRQIIDRAVLFHFYLHIGFVRVDAQRHV